MLCVCVDMLVCVYVCRSGTFPSASSYRIQRILGNRPSSLPRRRTVTSEIFVHIMGLSFDCVLCHGFWHLLSFVSRPRTDFTWGVLGFSVFTVGVFAHPSLVTSLVYRVLRALLVLDACRLQATIRSIPGNILVVNLFSGRCPVEFTFGRHNSQIRLT